MSEDVWLDGYDIEVISGRPGLDYADDDESVKILLHTTEGHSVAGALGAYRNGTGCPHVTVDLARGVYVQHVPLNKGAYALRNGRGGVETNRERVYQIEIVGFASEFKDTDWHMALALNVIRPIMDAMGDVPVVFPEVGFLGVDEAYGYGSRTRMTGPEWLGFSGILGHQHVPENTHWDPGVVDVDLLKSFLIGDESMGYFEKYSDSERGEEYIVSQKRDGKIVFRRFSVPRNDGQDMKGLGIVLDEWAPKGIVQEVKAV